MVQAVCAPSAGSSYVSGDSGSVLQAQLSKYQIQLADWQACPSGKTPEGQAKIADLTSKVQSTQQKIAQLPANTAGSSDNASQAAATPTRNPTLTTGNLINVTA